MKIEIDIHSEFADTVAAHSLSESYDYLVSCLDGTHALFSYDTDKEKEELTKLLKAFQLVMEWYGVEITPDEFNKLQPQLEVEKGKENVNERRVSRRNEGIK